MQGDLQSWEIGYGKYMSVVMTYIEMYIIYTYNLVQLLNLISLNQSIVS